MTQYFLHGGYVTRDTPQNRKFFEAVLASVKKERIQILVIPFAREESRWKEKFEEMEDRFKDGAGMKKLDIILGTREISSLRKQIQESDIIFLWGGETEMLEKELMKIKDLKDLLKGKVVAGSSAGSLVFSKYYYENDNQRYLHGLGFLDVGMICHWKDQYTEMENIKKFGEVNEVLCIAEGDYVIR